MSRQRVASLEPPYSEDVQRSFDTIMPAGVAPLQIFRTVGRNARVLSRMVNGGLLDRGSISIAQRELVILRSCARCGAQYEWGVHVAAFAGKAGFSDRQITDTCSIDTDEALWNDEQRALIEMVDELHATRDLADATWSLLKRYFSDEQLIELIMLAGLYHAISFLVNALRIAGEEGAPEFPPA